MTNYSVEIVLRDRDVAITEEKQTALAPRQWTETDVAEVLRGILRAIDKAQNPSAEADRPVALRGFSWIVEPTDAGVVIAIEIPMGAAVAGPFDADQRELDTLINGALRQQGGPAPTVH